MIIDFLKDVSAEYGLPENIGVFEQCEEKGSSRRRIKGTFLKIMRHIQKQEILHPPQEQYVNYN